MSDDNKEGAGVPKAYLLTRPSGFAWSAMPQDITPATRSAHEADGVRIDPLFLATPPAVMPAAPSDTAEARYRFLLGFLIERGVLTNDRYSNGTWCLRGIYGVDDSGLRGAGRTAEEAIDNAIVAANLDPAAARMFWQTTHAALSQTMQPQAERSFAVALGEESIRSFADPAAGEQAGAVASVAEFKSEYAQHEADIRGWVMQWARSGVSRQIAINGALNKMHDLYFAALAATPASEKKEAPYKSCRMDDGRCGICGGDWSVCGCDGMLRRDAIKAAQPVEREDGK